MSLFCCSAREQTWTAAWLRSPRVRTTSWPSRFTRASCPPAWAHSCVGSTTWVNYPAPQHLPKAIFHRGLGERQVNRDELRLHVFLAQGTCNQHIPRSSDTLEQPIENFVHVKAVRGSKEPFHGPALNEVERVAHAAEELGHGAAQDARVVDGPVLKT